MKQSGEGGRTQRHYLVTQSYFFANAACAALSQRAQRYNFSPRTPLNFFQERRRRCVTYFFRNAVGLATGAVRWRSLVLLHRANIRWRSLVLLHRANRGEAQRARRGGFSPNATKVRSRHRVTFLRSDRSVTIFLRQSSAVATRPLLLPKG